MGSTAGDMGVDWLPVGVFGAATDGACTYTNPTWCRLAALTPEQALGSGWVEAMHPDDRPRLLQRWEHCVATGETLEMDSRLQHPDGIGRQLGIG